MSTGGKFITGDEFLAMDLSGPIEPPRLQHWTWDKKFLIAQKPTGYRYEIPIAELHSPAGVCKWLGQIREKTWASNELLGEMVRAINHLVGDLRGLHCGCKRSTPVIGRDQS